MTPPPDISEAISAFQLAVMDFTRAEFADDFNYARDKMATTKAALLDAIDSAHRDGELYRAMLDACGKLPQWWDISFTCERDAGWIHLSDPDGNVITPDTFGSVDSTLAEQVAEALAFALEHDIVPDSVVTSGGA